jgi:uncharacterized protein (TIGR00255 family)
MSRNSPWASMTGYAQADLSVNGRHFKFQIKSVNHRFFEFRIRAPREWLMMENEFKAWCKEVLQRGSVDFSIEESRGTSNSRGTTETDFARARIFVSRLAEALAATQGDWGAAQVPQAERALILARNIDVWAQDVPTKETENLPPAEELRSFVEGLCQKLLVQRLGEGEETRRSVVEHAQSLRREWSLVSAELPALKEAWRKGLEERIQKLSASMGGSTLDPARVYQEFVMLADKRDVSEEIQRIDSHLKVLETLTLEPREDAIGKRLDFVAQELGREWTTLGNKIQDAALNQHVGEAKLTIEKIREQSLNLV